MNKTCPPCNQECQQSDTCPARLAVKNHSQFPLEVTFPEAQVFSLVMVSVMFSVCLGILIGYVVCKSFG
jgi:hypothetical protein